MQAGTSSRDEGSEELWKKSGSPNATRVLLGFRVTRLVGFEVKTWSQDLPERCGLLASLFLGLGLRVRV